MDESTTYLKEIEPAVMDYLNEEVKNFATPSFPLNDLAKKIKATFLTDSMEISLGTREWKSHETILNGLGKNPISLPLELTPLEGALFWVMGSEDIEKLISWMKFSKGEELKISSPDLLKGIYRYIALEVADIMSNLSTFSDFSVKMGEKMGFDQMCFSIDVSLKNGEESVWGRLVLSKELKRSFENHFSIKKVTLKDLEQTAGKLSLALSLNVGGVELSQDELNQLKEGDLIVPDALHYNPKLQKGNIRVMLGEKALFVAKPKEGHVKLMDTIYAYQETSHG